MTGHRFLISFTLLIAFCSSIQSSSSTVTNNVISVGCQNVNTTLFKIVIYEVYFVYIYIVIFRDFRPFRDQICIELVLLLRTCCMLL